jgi:hypothetical protein
MSQIRSTSLARCYGMARVARVWKFSPASVYRSRKAKTVVRVHYLTPAKSINYLKMFLPNRSYAQLLPDKRG